jgi:poly(A) polymerase
MNLFSILCPLGLKNAFSDVDLRLVGGCVRDFFVTSVILRNASPFSSNQQAETKGDTAQAQHDDVDFVVNIPPEKIIQKLKQAKIAYFLTGVKFGTVTAIIGEKHFEITSLRQDVTHYGRHPEVTYTTSFEQDASRRDFTFNAMYIDKHGILFDPYNGQRDLENGIIRFIGAPHKRIIEDPLRILRFYRFFGKICQIFDIESKEAVKSHMHLIWELSKERIWDELEKIIKLKRRFEILTLLAQDKFYEGMNISSNLPILQNPSSITTFASMNLNIQFNWSKKESQLFDQLLKLRKNTQTPLRLNLHHSKELIMQIIALRFLDGIYTYEQYQEHQEKLSKYTTPIFPLKGSDLIKRGIPEGKEIGQTLKKVKRIWEEASDTMSDASCLELAMSFCQTSKITRS